MDGQAVLARDAPEAISGTVGHDVDLMAPLRQASGHRGGHCARAAGVHRGEVVREHQDTHDWLALPSQVYRDTRFPDMKYGAPIGRRLGPSDEAPVCPSAAAGGLGFLRERE